MTVKSSTRNHIYKWFSSKTCQFIDDFPNNIQVNDFPCKSQVERKFPTTKYPFFWKPRCCRSSNDTTTTRAFPLAPPHLDGRAQLWTLPLLGMQFLALMVAAKMLVSPATSRWWKPPFGGDWNTTYGDFSRSKMVIDTTNQWLEHGDLIQSTKMIKNEDSTSICFWFMIAKDSSYLDWLVVFRLPLWKIMEWKSVGMMTFPTEWKTSSKPPSSWRTIPAFLL